jgi:hypothetical protein
VKRHSLAEVAADQLALKQHSFPTMQVGVLDGYGIHPHAETSSPSDEQEGELPTLALVRERV